MMKHTCIICSFGLVINRFGIKCRGKEQHVSNLISDVVVFLEEAVMLILHRSFLFTVSDEKR